MAKWCTQKKNGDGYVDTPAKEARILAAVGDALNN